MPPKDTTPKAEAPSAQPQPNTFVQPGALPPEMLQQAQPATLPSPLPALQPQPQTAATLLERLPDHVRNIVISALRDAETAIVTAAEKAIARALPSVDGMQYRPPLDIPIHQLGEVALGNFLGRFKSGELIGRHWRVAHATPLRGLPQEVIAAIRSVPGQSTGIIAPPVVKPGLPRAA